ncbi:MAG: DNA-directed RNA polymerase subunit omega [Alphaproteobacteria bacterium]|nr:DNA-directed RNA polymerase subunit omega [Alphaproteobacteria bacterium]
MARTTNSDTLPFVESRYELGMLASQRVRDLNGGVEPVVDKNNDKMTVVALREIASGKLDVDAVRHEFIQSYKETPVVEAQETALEIGSEDPEVRGFAAELDGESVTEDIEEEDLVPDESEDEE